MTSVCCDGRTKCSMYSALMVLRTCRQGGFQENPGSVFNDTTKRSGNVRVRPDKLYKARFQENSLSLNI
jgi:hypothetical protein